MRPSGILKGIFLLAMLFAGGALGTAQAPDILIVDGERESLYTNPLSAWLEDHPDALPRGNVMSSGNWRGYVATWEIASGKLWLRELTVTDRIEKASGGDDDAEPGSEYVERDVMGAVFPEAGNVAADWYTGTLIIPKGKMVAYVHMGYGSQYERYTVVWVRRGEVTRRLDLSGEQFMELRKQRFEAFRRTDAYRRHIAELGKGGSARDASETDGFLFEFAAEEYLSADPEATGD